MKYCSQCGKPISESASFCNHCGAAVEGQQASANPASAEPIKKSEHMEKIKEKSSTYFHYLARTIKRPSSSLQENNKWYGYVTCVLSSLFFAATMFRMLGSFWSFLLDLLISSFGVIGTPGVVMGADVFFKLFFIYLAFLAVYVGVCYGINRLLLKNHINFHVFLTRFSGFLSLSLIVSVIAIIFSLMLGMSGATFITLLVAVCAQFAYLAFTIMLVLPKNNGPVDRFYIITIGWAVIATISYIVVRIATSNLINTIMNELQNSYFV